MDKSQWKAFFTGDIFIKDIEKNNFIDSCLEELMISHDIVSCNFEAPVLKEGAVPIPKSGPNLYMPVEAVDIVKRAGFNLIALANNHILDYGEDCFEYTLNLFSDKTILGAAMDFESAYKIKKIEIGGITVGFASYCELQFGALTDVNSRQAGYAWINHPRVNSDILKAKEEVDLIVVQVHAGVEMEELPFPEWRARYRELVDCGADMIIGHHPHVPQGWELYREKPIFYSLGNFRFDMEDAHPYWKKSYGISAKFEGKKLESFEVIPFEEKNGQVCISYDKKYIEYLEYLRTSLESARYTELVDRQALKEWDDYIEMYFRLSLGVKKKVDYLLLLHLLRDESLRWSAERALYILGKGGY